jgi:hypothetical protein
MPYKWVLRLWTIHNLVPCKWVLEFWTIHNLVRYKWVLKFWTIDRGALQMGPKTLDNSQFSAL